MCAGEMAGVRWAVLVTQILLFLLRIFLITSVGSGSFIFIHSWKLIRFKNYLFIHDGLRYIFRISRKASSGSPNRTKDAPTSKLRVT